jgi:hypothetical protein
VTVAVDRRADIPFPAGVAAPARGRLLIAEFLTGAIFDARGATVKVLATGLHGASGVDEDAQGNVYVSSLDEGKLWRFKRPTGSKPADPTVVADGYQQPADFYLDRQAKQLVLPDTKAGTVTFLPLPK